MCTVTFLPLDHSDFILTSNRDEQNSRVTIPPKIYEENTVAMMYPKDKIAGGTWIGVSGKKRLICVLNGAFIKHVRKPAYSKSRGIIAKELLSADRLSTAVEKLELAGVEPFTIVIVDWNKTQLELFEFIWDEKKVYFNKLNNEPHIWSSSTLYSAEIKEKRRNWFSDWQRNNTFTTSNILSFHHSEIGDKSQSVLMKRPYVETVSITTVKKEKTLIEMDYEDVVHQKIYTAKFS